MSRVEGGKGGKGRLAKIWGGRGWGGLLSRMAIVCKTRRGLRGRLGRTGEEAGGRGVRKLNKR